MNPSRSRSSSFGTSPGPRRARGRRSRPQPATRRRLSFEALEARQLLAADLLARFEFTDSDGTPLAGLQTGQDFLLRLYIQDIRSNPQGAFQVFFDINYDPSLVSAVGPIAHGPAYSAPGTTSGDLSVSGLIDEIGGQDTDQLRPSPRNAELLLLSLPFHANNPGTLNVTADLADRPDRIINFFDTVSALQLEQISFTGGTVTIAAAGIQVAPTSGLTTTEGGAAAAFEVVLTQPPAANVTIGLASSDAGEGTVSPASLVFTPTNWNSAQQVTVTGVPDEVIDGPIGYTIVTGPAVSTDATYSGLDPADVSVTNADDDATTVSITATDPTGSEPGTDDGLFTVRLDGGKLAPPGGIAVNYSVSGTATAGADYVSLGGSVLIPAGVSSATIPVDVLNDQVIELAESVAVTLIGTNNASATIHPSQNVATVTVNDDDATTASVSASDDNGSEPGTNDGQFTVSLDGGKIAPPGGILINYSVGGTATANADYTTLPGSVTIPAGTSSATIAVDVLNDNVVELAETVVLTLTSTNHAGVAVSAANPSATVTVPDDDATTVSIAATDANGSESGNNGALFTVTLAGNKVAPAAGIVVNYAVTGTATAGADYTALPGSVTIPAGASSATIAIAVLDDNVVETSETVVLTLTGADHPAITVSSINNQSTATLADNDATTASISANDAAGGEPGANDAQFTVTLDGGKTAPIGGIAVTYTVSGTATAGTDYAALTGSVTIPAGASATTIFMNVLDDQVIEPAESVILTLTGVNHPAVSISTSDNTATATIADDDATTVSITPTDATGSEPGTDDGLFTVRLDGGKLAPSGGIVVSYTVSGIASAGTDYVSLPGSLTIPAGASSATISVDVLNDQVVEGPETVVLTLTGTNHPSAAIHATDNSATVTIADDDSTTVSIVAADANGAEPGGDDAQFTVTLDGGKVAATGGIVVSYTVSGTASGGSDYAALPGSVTIPAGGSSAVIIVDVLDDQVVEGSEPLIVTLTATNHTSVAVHSTNNQAIVTIADDDATTVSIAATDAAAGEPGANGGLFTVTLAGGKLAPAGGIVVAYTVNGTATGGADYAALSGSVTIPAGASSVTIAVDVLDDEVIESAESAIVTLTGTNHPSAPLHATNRSATVTISDDDATTVAITASDAAANELGADAGVFLVALNGDKVAPAGGITVTYAVSGTATPGADYAPLTGTALIPAGQSLVTIPVSVLDDSVIENAETVVVTLSTVNQVGVTIDPTKTSATVTLNDDDATTVSVSAPDPTGSESGSDSGQFLVSLDNGRTAPAEGIQVSYTINGTATSGADYAALAGTVTIPAGQSSATIAVDVVQDNIVEVAETAILTLSTTNHPAATIHATNNSATVTIADDDATTVSISATDATASEAGTNGGLLTVSLDGGKVAPAGGIVVNYDAGGSAEGGADYVALTGSVTIPAGAASATIAVDVLDDNVIELPEAVVVTLTAVSHPAVTISSSANQAEVAIADDDATTVSIEASTAESSEPGLDGEFTVTLDGGKLAPPGGISVTYTILGTATPGVDYLALTGTTTIPAGQASVAIPVAVLDDPLVEAAETVILTLTGTDHPAVTVSVSSPTAIVTITDDDAAVVGVSGPQPTDEGDAGTKLLGFTVTLSDPVEVPVSIDYATADGAAQDENGDGDYQSAGGTLTFLPGGDLTQTITVAVNGDTVLEPDETFQVVLSNLQAGTPARNVSLGDAAATATIVDDDAARLTIVVMQDAAEDATDGLFTVTTDKLLSQPIQVSLSISGSATAGDDYQAISTVFTFPANTTSVTIPVAVLPDNMIEGPETVVVQITGTSDPAARPGSPDSALLTIADDEATTVSIEAADATAGEPGANEGSFLVALGGGKVAPPQGITVSYAVTGSALAGTDYAALPGIVTIPAGQSSALISVQVLDDDVVELTETVTVALLGTDNAGVTVDLVNDTDTVAIADDDPASVSIARVDDGAESATPAPGKFRVTLSQISSTETVLSYSVTGTATAGPGNDYAPLVGSVTIPAGVIGIEIAVAVLDDDLVEATETVTVTLGGITSAAPGISLDDANGTATVSIADNDTAVVSIAKISDGAEGALPTVGTFRVTQSKPSSTDTVLSYTVNGTATPGAGDDYSPLAGSVTIAAGTTFAEIDVAVLNDDVVEGPESVIVTLSGITSGHPQISLADAGKKDTVTIADDDTATVSIAQVSDGAEGGVPSDGKFQVTLSRVSSTDTVLSYTVGGTATPGAGDDYMPLSGSVTIAAGTTTADIDVAVLDDDLVEGPEIVTVTLAAITSANPQIAIAVPNNPATLSIGDDDVGSVSIVKLADGDEAGTTHGTFQISQTKASSTATVLNYTVSGTAIPGPGQDYTPLSGTVTIAAGSLTANIDVAVLNDDLVESTETVVVSLTAVASGAAEISINSSGQSASLDIRDDDAATVSIDGVSNGAEGSVLVDGRFRVTQTKAGAADTVLSYLVAGTATAGDDYQLLSGTVTIAAGGTTADIVVPVRNDPLVEATETVNVTLWAVTSGDPDVTINQANKTATVSILDNPTTVSIAATSPIASEPGAQKGEFTVSLASGWYSPLGGVQINYTVSGSASAGADYTALSGVATIPAGQSSVQISIDVLNDNLVEMPETVSVTLTETDHPSVAIAPTNDQATVTINDDDGTTVSLTASDPTGSEPDDDGQFTVMLGGGKVAPSAGIVVSYTISGTATAGTDYAALAGTVTIPAGQSSATILVEVLGDNIVEVLETVELTLTGTDHAGVAVSATGNTASMTINDGVGETTVSIAATDATGSEPGANDGLLTVSLSEGKLAPEGGITVTYAVSGTATSGSDYTAHTGTVTIPGGQATALIPVDVLDDSIVEVPETVIVTLTGSNHPGVMVDAASNTATVTIADDDPTTVSIAATDDGGSEPGTDDGRFTVTLAGGKVAPSGGITVSYSLSGTATAGSDYATLSGAVTIPAGANSATISVDVLDDNIVELPETVLAALTGTNHAGVTVGTTGNAATVTITDDDPTTVSIAASDAAGSEPGNDDGAFTVTLDNGKVAPTGGIAVTYTVAGTAAAGTDYTTLTGTVTIPAGQSSVIIPVDALDDNIVEVPETVMVTLTGTNHAGAIVHATNTTATVTIDSADDDTTVSIAAADASGLEPGADDAQFTVTLGDGKVAPTGGIFVNYTTGGTATAGSDLAALSGSVTIPAGASTATIAVDVLDDNVVESAETVVVTLTATNHAGATIAAANNAATVTIEDDDATTVSIGASDANAGEPADDGQFTVTLANSKVAPPGGIVVSYTTAGTATAGSDYTALSGSVTIPAGASSAAITVDVIADTTADEPAETVVVTLTSANHPSVTLSTASPTATVTITADDVKNASISGIVWIDANNDRQQQKDTAGNPLEPGIPGVIVRLTGTARDGSTLNLQAMTDDDGAYRFIHLPAGTYEVREEQPAAWIDGQEMLTSSTVNDTYSNLVLTPGQQAVDYSFGERTLQPQFISKRQFLASTPVTEVYLREVNALAKQRAGDAAGAQAIRDASIPSEVSGQSTSNAQPAQDESLPEASDATSDETSLAAGESTRAAPPPTPGGEGEAVVSPVPVAPPPAGQAAPGLDARPAKDMTEATSFSALAQPASPAVSMNGWGFAARSQLAPVHADPPSAATRLGGQMPVAGRAETSSGFPRLGPSVSGFLDTQAVTRQDVPKAPAFQPIGKLPKPGPAEDHRITTTTRQISDRVPSRRLPQADQGPDAAQLVDLVFAAAAWLDGP